MERGGACGVYDLWRVELLSIFSSFSSSCSFFFFFFCLSYHFGPQSERKSLGGERGMFFSVREKDETNDGWIEMFGFFSP